MLLYRVKVSCPRCKRVFDVVEYITTNNRYLCVDCKKRKDRKKLLKKINRSCRYWYSNTKHKFPLKR